MDSRLLAGAYSKRYKYIEEEEIENLKARNHPEGNDVLAKARRLSQETNKRRKKAEQKLRTEQAREEKRRQEILNKRHQEQKDATEKYQRSHVGSARHRSPHNRGHSPGGRVGHVQLEEALRLVRGETDDNSRQAVERMHNGSLRGSQSHNAHLYSASGARPLSGRRLDAAIRAELMERSLRNVTNSRNRFEQQLEHHQQLLAQQQQQSLRDFNQAIRREIDDDTKVAGIEEDETENRRVMERNGDGDDASLCSDSLSSEDSLEAEKPTSLNSSLQIHQTLRQFHTEASQQRDARHFDTENSGEQAARGRGPVNNVPTSLAGTNGHVVGPIPQGYYNPLPNGIPPSSTPVIQGNMSYYHDSLEGSGNGERHVTVGTALRLPQQPSQPIKQPAPALQYNSQLLASRKFEARPYVDRQNSDSGVDPKAYSQQDSRQDPRAYLHSSKAGGEATSDVTQNQLPPERPKAHIYAWTSPPPVEGDHNSSLYPSGMSETKPIASVQGSSVPSSYSLGVAADRVMATNLHPTTSRTISTAATTTWVYQTVGPAQRDPVYSQAIGDKAYMSQADNNNSHCSAQPVKSYVDIPRGHGQKPGTSLTSNDTYPSSTGLRFLSTTPSTFANHQTSDDSRQYIQSDDSRQYIQSENNNNVGSSAQKGSLTQGTLGLVNGRPTTIFTEVSDVDRKIMVVEDRDSQKEVKSILKRVDSAKPKPAATCETKFNVQDSVEITKKHLHTTHEMKEEKKKLKKKGVRFADLQYPDVEEDFEQDNQDISTIPAKSEESSKQQPAQRPRPASARVVSTTKPIDTRPRGPRITSAGPSRPPPASRPKAAAHIIVSGDAGSHHPNHSVHIAHGNPAHHDTGGPAIFAHKSQLDKKVVMIHNNFMSRVPAYSSPATMATTPASVTTAYTMSGNLPQKNGTAATATYPASTIPINGSMRSAQTDAGRWAGKVVPTPSSTTVLPSHSHFSSYTAASSAVYNDTGLRIDRTPTDDEINKLWKKTRSMLDVTDCKNGQPQQQGQGQSNMSMNNNSAADYNTRTPVHLSQQYFDGAALGIPNGMSRVATASTTTKTSPSQISAVSTQAVSKPTSGKNGYMQRFSLLQQRKGNSSTIGLTRANGIVEQTVQPITRNSGLDPRFGQVNISYAPREEMSESMAEFLAAEQVVQTQGADVRDSRVMAAMQSAQNQQEMYNSVRQKLARGGPGALSMEEQKLLESLDKLNERLKVVDNRTTNNPVSNLSNTAPSNHIYIHGSGFRGQQVITSGRRNSAGLKPMGRPMSARLLTRPYH